MTQRRTGLGRGLDALIPSAPKTDQPVGMTLIPTANIQRNPHQPRTHFDAGELAELADSIREHGVLQPLIVRHTPESGLYTLIAGERRWQAAQLAGLKEIPVIIREASDQQLLELALIENVQRADLAPLETAEAYRQLADSFGLTQEQIASRVGKSRVAVNNTLRLLKLPETVQAALAEGKISEGHARALLPLEHAAAQAAVLQTILVKELNVRQTEELVRKYLGRKPEPRANPGLDPELKALEERLRSSLGTRVSLRPGRRGGAITIHYYSDEELETLLERLLNE